MAYTKNLGRVKGEKGDLYFPTITYTDNGEINFTWNKIVDENSERTKSVSFKAPVFVPEYDEQTGICRFVPNMPVNINGEIITANTVGTRYSWSIKGEKGDPAVAEFDIKHTNKTLEELIADFREKRGNTDFEQFYNSSTLYIVTPNSDSSSSADIYVYDDNDNINDSDRFIKLEGLDLSKYYKKNETYSNEEIDNMFDVQHNYLQEIFRLLDVEDNEYTLNGVTLNDETLNTLLDEKLTDYVKLADIEYVDIDGVLYFVQRRG